MRGPYKDERTKRMRGPRESEDQENQRTKRIRGPRESEDQENERTKRIRGPRESEDQENQRTKRMRGPRRLLKRMRTRYEDRENMGVWEGPGDWEGQEVSQQEEREKGKKRSVKNDGFDQLEWKSLIGLL